MTTVGIELKGLSKSYGTTLAVKPLDLSVRPGEWITLLGPSGCGKTTTLRIIAGFIEPTSGTVAIGDRIVSDPARKVMIPIERRRLGMVFQAYAVWPHMTVLQNVAYPLKLRRMNKNDVRKRALAALEQVQLDGLDQRYPHELSGGQQQRVALARALVSEPGVLLLDEPLSALDAKLRLELRELLSALHHDTGLTVVFVTHDQDEALTLSDRVVVMRDGVVQQVGTPNGVYEAPINTFVAAFIGSGTILPVVVRAGELYVREVKLGQVRSNPPPTAILIRPEHVRIHGGGAIRCTVQRSWFKGDHAQLELASTVGELTARHAKLQTAGTVLQVDIEKYTELRD